MTRDDLETLQNLIELVQAIDRRSPHLHRRGEAAIASAAMALRAQAQARITELQSGAVMSRTFSGPAPTRRENSSR